MSLFCFLGICHTAPIFFVHSMSSLCGGSELFYVFRFGICQTFFDCHGIDFVTFCLWKDKYPLL